MKRMTIATTIALGLAGVSSVSAQTTSMQHVTVTGEPAQYEIYAADLHLGYGLEALVGNTHRQYMQAQREAERSEALRRRGLAQRAVVTVAIDNSSGPGVARQIQLIDSAHDTVAIVNMYCKRVVPSGGRHCLLAPGNTYTQRLASRQAGSPQVAEVELGR
jgi:hypothetical protein